MNRARVHSAQPGGVPSGSLPLDTIPLTMRVVYLNLMNPKEAQKAPRTSRTVNSRRNRTTPPDDITPRAPPLQRLGTDARASVGAETSSSNGALGIQSRNPADFARYNPVPPRPL